MTALAKVNPWAVSGVFDEKVGSLQKWLEMMNFSKMTAKSKTSWGKKVASKFTFFHPPSHGTAKCLNLKPT